MPVAHNHYSFKRSFFALSLLCLACSAEAQPGQDSRKAEFSYKLIPAGSKSWGYDIYSGNKKLIHQVAIPALQGNTGFKYKADARKTALLVISKLRNGIMPPSVTVKELQSLNIIRIQP